MFTLKISGLTVLCSKFFAATDRESVLAAIPEGTRRVVFIDTPATAELAPTIETLLGRGIEIHVRDHHDEPNPANPGRSRSGWRRSGSGTWWAVTPSSATGSATPLAVASSRSVSSRRRERSSWPIPIPMCPTEVVMSLLREVRMSHFDRLSGTPDSCKTVEYDNPTSRYVKKDIDRHDVLKRLIRKEIKRYHASKLLKLTPRHVTRLKQAVITSGATALIHKQRGQPSHNRLPEKERAKIACLLKEQYHDFGPTFAAEKLNELHKIDHDPKTIRAIQIKEGLWKPRRSKTKDVHRSWRQRRLAAGEMIQFDGSYHDWFEGRGGVRESCLLGSIDDATGMIVELEFAPHEGVFPVFAFWKAYIEIHGKPRQIYMDKFSTYKMNSHAAKDNPDLKTQFERAMIELHIEPLFANSPQAKGRVERLFDTLQDESREGNETRRASRPPAKRTYSSRRSSFPHSMKSLPWNRRHRQTSTNRSRRRNARVLRASSHVRKNERFKTISPSRFRISGIN